MDINQVVIYEHIHDLVVTYPNSDKKTGLTMGIRSSSSEKCKAIMRKHTNQQANQNRAKQQRLTAEVLEQNELEQTAASIAWWKWEKGDDGEEATYNGHKPPLDMNIAIEILGTVNWLYAQVKEAGQNLRKFYAERRERLCEHLEQFVEYDAIKDKQGRTRRERNEAFGESQLNPEPIELEIEETRYIDLFYNISRLRTSGMNGINPIQPDQVKGWMDLQGIQLTLAEVSLILDMDVSFRRAVEKEQERARPSQEAGRPTRGAKTYG